jgi:hypothetical protein
MQMEEIINIIVTTMVRQIIFSNEELGYIPIGFNPEEHIAAMFANLRGNIFAPYKSRTNPSNKSEHGGRLIHVEGPACEMKQVWKYILWLAFNDLERWVLYNLAKSFL